MDEPMQYAIETRGLEKRFGQTLAVDAVDLQVRARAVTGFLGPNGAGKTTTIRMLLGLLRPTSGMISILGMAMPAERRRIAANVGALVETPCHYDNLTGRENLEITRRLLGLAPAEVGRVLDLVDLAAAAGQRVGGYSLGMRQRLGIARALLGRPRLLVLDEPTNGLDPDGIMEVRTLIRSFPERDNVSVLVSSHLLAEVEQTVEHVALLWQGRLVAQAPLRELLARSGRRIVVGSATPQKAAAVLERHGFRSKGHGPGEFQILGEGAAQAARINALLVENGIAIHKLCEEQPTLEDAYRALTAPDAGLREAA
jgi:ABC-type multidrug transport system ATPase subunit